jgi:hypothetical protein
MEKILILDGKHADPGSWINIPDRNAGSGDVLYRGL